MIHINEQHPNYQTEMENRHHSTSLSTFAVSKKAENVFSCVKRVTIKGLPFSFVEDESTRQFSKLEPISKQSLLSYMEKITVSVEESIKAELPSKFGIVIDGWSDLATSTHYLAIFGCYPDPKSSKLAKAPLLAFSPLQDEERYDANSHCTLISETLRLFGKNETNLSFMVSDNENLNRAIASNLGVFMIECNSHRLHLAVKIFLRLENYEELLEKVNAVMKKLATLKKSGKLRKKTDLRSKIRSEQGGHQHIQC